MNARTEMIDPNNRPASDRRARNIDIAKDSAAVTNVSVLTVVLAALVAVY